MKITEILITDDEHKQAVELFLMQQGVTVKVDKVEKAFTEKGTWRILVAEQTVPVEPSPEEVLAAFNSRES